jgi:hypothetical protein
MTLRIFLPLLFGFVMFAQNGIAQTQKNQNTQLVKFGKNVDAPLTAQELSMIKEVYQDKLDAYVLSKPQKVKNLKHLLRNRIVIKEITNLKDDDKYTLLSEVELFDIYNPSLKRDVAFNKSTFNPLKYNLEFYRMGSIIYKIDGTNFFIIIKPQTYKK